MTSPDPSSYASRLSDNGLAIFLLHGVIEKQHRQVRNYTRKHLEKDYFVQFLRGLSAAGGAAVSLEDVVAAQNGGPPLPPRAFAITFDDGFRNNLTIAAPLLADLNIPATFYVTTGFVAENGMSWIDRIEIVMETTAAATLRLPWGERSYHDPLSARAVLDDIRANAKRNPDLNLDAFANDVQAQLGRPGVRSSDDPLDQKLNWADVRRLAEHDLFTVGGHTHTHAILSFLDDAALAAELDLCETLLRDMADVSCRHYSYPEGLAHCYSDRVIEALRARGTVCCPTAEDGVNPTGGPIDLFRLKRVFVV